MKRIAVNSLCALSVLVVEARVRALALAIEPVIVPPIVRELDRNETLPHSGLAASLNERGGNTQGRPRVREKPEQVTTG